MRHLIFIQRQITDICFRNHPAAAAAAAKSLQSCPTLCDPVDGSSPGSPIPGILQAKILEWGAIAFSVYLVKMMVILERKRCFKES